MFARNSKRCSLCTRLALHPNERINTSKWIELDLESTDNCAYPFPAAFRCEIFTGRDLTAIAHAKGNRNGLWNTPRARGMLEIGSLHSHVSRDRAASETRVCR